MVAISVWGVEMSMNVIRVLIVEDIETLQRRYKNALSKDPGISVVGAAYNSHEAVMLTALHQPHIILMDIELESKEAGLEAAREILRVYPHIKIVILTVYEEDDLVFTAFKYGAVDYILKKASPGEIIRGVKDAYYNRSPIRPFIAEKIRGEFQRVKNAEESFLYFLNVVTQLTPTELDVLTLLVKGNSRKEICAARNVELSTVKTQIHNILKKFDKRSISEVTHQIKKLKIMEYLQKPL